MTNPYEPPSGEPPAEPQPQPPPPPGGSPYGQPMPPYAQGMPPPYAASPYGQFPYGQHPGAVRNGLGTAALVLGIIGVVCGATVVLFFLAFILGVLAVIFGLIGRGRAKRAEATNETMATWGFALGVVSLVLSVIGLVVVIHVGQDRRDCRARAVTPEQFNACNHKF